VCVSVQLGMSVFFFPREELEIFKCPVITSGIY
jgi:hypothetical protein